MDTTPLRICYSVAKTRIPCANQLNFCNVQRIRNIHATSIRTAKQQRKPQPKNVKKQPQQRPQQQQRIPEYKPPTPSRPLDTTPEALPSQNDFEKHRRFMGLPMIIGLIPVFLTASYISYHFYISSLTSTDSDATSTSDYAAQADVSERYAHIAKTFDTTVDSTEYSMGIQSLRRKLVAEAKGDVLEASIGTGRNLEYYDWELKGGKVRSLTGVDISGEMLEIAHDKFSKMFPGILGVRWVIADASKAGVIPGPPRNADERSGSLAKKYDTVIQTFGLCSANDPVGLLRNLGECVDEDEGRIFLLEHGRGVWGWLNRMLDQTAEKHAVTYGCWWNRDMERIVEESGLEVVRVDGPWWHGGTTWWIELKKPKATVQQLDKKVESATDNVVEKHEIPAKEQSPSMLDPRLAKPWWWPWSPTR